jgi:hypothetical protein
MQAPEEKTMFNNTSFDPSPIKCYGNLILYTEIYDDFFIKEGYIIHTQAKGKKYVKHILTEFDFVELCIKKFGLQATIEHYGKDIPAPEGYAEVHEGTTIKLWYPWDKKDYRTLLNPIKFGMIKQFAEIAPEGIFYELGVYTGGVTRMLLDIGKTVVAFDTFEGIKGATEMEYHSNGDFRCDDVFEYIKGAEIIKGELPNTLYGRTDKIAFCHFDLDVEIPTSGCIEFVYNRLVEGGIIIFDDYGTWTTDGVKRAVDNFNFGKKIYLPTGQMVIFK